MAKARTYTQAEVALMLAGQPLPAEPIISMATAPAISTANLPPWAVEAASAALATARTPKPVSAPKPASVKPHHVASPGSYTPDKGSNAGIPIPGLRVVKMFGDQPNKLSKFGKFLTFGEAQAVYAFIRANGGQ